MKYFTKEWYMLMQSLGAADMYEPVAYQETYSDEDIEMIYDEALDARLEEERALYDEPPALVFDTDYFDTEEFDPEDYLIGDIYDGEDEDNIRHPESVEELLKYMRLEWEHEYEEWVNRPAFDEEEVIELFEEEYADNLEDPDEDLPEWVRESVDPRLLAMYRMPDKILIKLRAEDEANQEKYDEIETRGNDALEELYQQATEDDITVIDDLNNIVGDYVTEINSEDGELELVLSGWDDEGDPAIKRAAFEDAEIIEDEGLRISSEVDEDGDLVSDCDLLWSEVYITGHGSGKKAGYEIHLLLDNGGLKYLTFRCSDVSITQEPLWE